MGGENRQGINLQILHGLDLATSVSPSWTVEVICSAYQRFGSLRVLIQSFLNQTDSNWNLHVLHDGPSVEFNKLADSYMSEYASRLRFSSSEKRFNDYGHSLREIGLRASTGDYVLITNDDNYYVPVYMRLVNLAIARCSPDLIIYDMVHSHEFPGNRIQESYSFFPTAFMRNSLDMGSGLVKGDLARMSNFKDKGFAADWDYFSNIAYAARDSQMRIIKIPKILFVHN